MREEDVPKYTGFRLSHATPEHLHATSLIKFVGPIPHSWITTYKKRWFHKPRTNYHRKDLPFDRDISGGLDCQNLSTCARWQAEAECVQLKRAATAREEQSRQVSTESQLPHIAEHPDDFHEAFDSLTGSVNDEAGAQAHKPLISPTICLKFSTTDHPEALSSSPIVSPRPTINILDPSNSMATRESSSVSQASFATAPETFGEQPESDNSDVDSEREAEVDGESSSDTSTIRGAAKEYGSKSEASGLPAAVAESPAIPIRSEPSSNSNSFKSNSNQRTISPGQDSQKSLIHRPSESRPSPAQPEHIPNVVRFSSKIKSHPLEAPTQPICAEGQALDTDTGKENNQRKSGHFNQAFLRNPFRKPEHEGELLRAERMLLRIEYTTNGGVPNDYSETSALRLDRRVSMHWREFVVAARSDEHGRVVLTFHRTRRIPAIAKGPAKIKAAKMIIINPLDTKCNLYSALDKTIVIWTKVKRRTMIYIMRPGTTNSSIEWYAFLQSSLGVKPRTTVVITVPNLNVKLRVSLKSAEESAEISDPDMRSLYSRKSDSDSSVPIINDAGQVVSNGVTITAELLVQLCWRLLSRNKEWTDVLSDWREHERMGLCWRRYDRLEWIHGRDAKQLVGQWAMGLTHELEFRPKEHYSTVVQLPGGKRLEEPAPIEGFLVRLTSSTGRQARFGKVFYKRLYFATHNSFLFFAKPENTVPPPPPGFDPGDMGNIKEVLEQSPLVYDIDPYPLVDDHISWLQDEVTSDEKVAKDIVALTEADRRVKQLHKSEGYIDLAKVVKIRRCKRMKDDIKNDIGHNGTGVRFANDDEESGGILITENEGAVDEFDDQRVFELILSSGLVIRLQAFDKETRDVWMTHLSKLINYWAPKLRQDQTHFRSMKQANMQVLKIDEEAECLIGRYANKWEVAQCVTEPQIYNFCSIAACRTISHHGLLYRKPRVHSTFKKYEYVVSHGKMISYNHLHYDAGGTQEHHIHHSRNQVIDLQDCYVFSGTVAEADLLSTRDSSDREGPGRHSLPRLYNDGWTSQDEQEALCFVLWASRKRFALSSNDKEDAKNNKVSRLGISGHHLIFMARCRQERDLWVQVISNEIQKCSDRRAAQCV